MRQVLAIHPVQSITRSANDSLLHIGWLLLNTTVFHGTAPCPVIFQYKVVLLGY